VKLHFPPINLLFINLFRKLYGQIQVSVSGTDSNFPRDELRKSPEKRGWPDCQGTSYKHIALGKFLLCWWVEQKAAIFLTFLQFVLLGHSRKNYWLFFVHHLLEPMKKV